MSDAQGIVLLTMVTLLLSGFVGGIAGALIVANSHRRTIEVRPVADGVIDMPVQVHTEPVALRVRATVAEIDPLIVPIVMAPLPTTQDLATRVLARFPGAGPTDIAEIAGCSKSTAHAIIADFKAGFGAALQIPDESA